MAARRAGRGSPSPITGQPAALRYGIRRAVPFAFASLLALAVVNVGGTLADAVGDMRVDDNALSQTEITEVYGLVGHWKLAETSGTAATDSSGKAQNGAYSGGPTLAQAGPYPGAGQYAASFDGENDYVNGPAATSYVISDGFSIAGWVYLLANVNNAAMLENGSTTESCALRFTSSGQVRISGRSSGGVQSLTSTGTVPLGRWRHVVGTYDGATFRIYIDGQLDASSANAFTSVAASGNLTLAASLQGSDEYLNGRLHDVRLYNRPLSPAEVSELYGLIGHWKFDEAAGTAIADSSGNGRQAAFNNGSPAWTPGIYGSGLSFNGATDEAVTATPFAPPAVGTVAYWFRSTGMPAAQQRHFGLSGNWEAWQNPDGIIRFDLCGDGEVGGFKTLAMHAENGRWCHVCAMYDAADESFSIYIDGQLHRTGTATVNLHAQTATPLTFANRTGASNRFAGALDDFRVYNRKLSAWEVYQIYGMMAWYKMDEAAGSVAVDSTGRGMDGTYSGGPTLNVAANGAPAQGSAVAFNGSNYMEAAGLYDKSTSVSASAWVRFDGSDASGAEVISLGDCFYLRLSGGAGGVRASYFNGSTYVSAIGSPIVLNTGWRHVAAVLDDGSTLKAYLDGVEVASSATSGGISYAGQGANTRIASHGNGGTSTDLTGRVDDVRVFNRALKPDDVFQIYRGTRINGIRILQWTEAR